MAPAEATTRGCRAARTVHEPDPMQSPGSPVSAPPKRASTGSPSHAEGPCLLPAPARPTQSSEPILFPKLRIRLADFPYLHCSIDQRLFTLETCCGYGYDLRRESTRVPRIFKGRPVQHRTPLQTRRSTGPWSLSPIKSVSGRIASSPYKEKTTLPGAPVSVSGLRSFTALTTLR